MKKITKIVSLLLVVVTIFGLTACSNTPDYSVDEMLQKGYAMLDPSGDATRNFTITINQGDKYSYTFNGRISNGSILSSLTVSRNGLKSNHKNLFLVSGENLCINMNGAMSASESEIGFKWTDTSALQNRFLTITKGYTYVQDVHTDLKTKVFADWATTRTGTSSGKGEFDYNFTYNNETAKNMLATFITKADENTAGTTTKIDDYIKTLTGDSFEVYEKSLSYYQDKVDIETEEINGEYVSTGTHIADLLKQELTSLKNLIDIEGSYITEGVSYTDKKGQSFKHNITFHDKDGKAYGSITIEINDGTTEAIDTSVFNYVTMEDFVGTMLTNIKNSKGVGYETNDFPYVATYTANQLTLTETNDLYKSVHVFDFENGHVKTYTVTFYTYNLNMHNALTNKYNSMNMKFVASNTDDLEANTGSGVLQYMTEGLSSKYSASDPIELLAKLEEIGVPTYGD